MSMVPSHTPRIETGCGKIYVILDGEPLESVRSVLGKSGGCNHAFMEALSRMIKLALREERPTREEIAHELRGIRCDKAVVNNGKWVLSCPDAIAQAMEGG